MFLARSTFTSVDTEAVMARTELPLSLTHAVVAAHIADLRAEAERHQLARTARHARPGARWPAMVVTALRDSLAEALPTSRSGGRMEPCPTC